MADNVSITPGVGATVAADEIAGALHQRVKITVGADGMNDGDVASGNPLPVTDSANEALLTTIDADTSSIATDTGTIAGDTTSIDGKITACNTGAVTVAASALPTGAATAAKQDTIAGHVDGIETLLGTIDADTSTIAGDTTSIDSKITACNTGAVTVAESALPTGASTEATLSTLNGKVTACNTGAVVLAAGTAGIGKLTANSGVDIGDVDVLSLPSLPAGTNNIGDVDVLSLPALAAGTNSIGQVQPTKFPTTDDAEYMNKYYTSAGATTDGIIWSPAAGKRWYVTDLIINVSAAATVTLEDDLTAGDSPVLKCELAANGGFCKRFATPLASGEDAADLLITTTAGNVYVTCVGYEV